MRTALAIIDFVIGGFGLLTSIGSQAPIFGILISGLLLASGGVIWESR